MLHFFRQLRQRFLTENRFSKYLLYAIGEILLVVVGILIALQVNNWNEERKSKVQELKILQNFKLSLAADSSYREESSFTYERARQSMDYLIAYMEKDLPYRDTLKYHFSNMANDWGLKYDFSTYEMLKSTDLNLISNESLRSNMINYYRYAEGIGANLSKRYTAIIEDASKTLFSKHFDQMWEGRPDHPQGVMIPTDYEALKKDHQFRYFLRTLKNQNYWLIERPTRISEELYLNITEDLDTEIEELSTK